MAIFKKNPNETAYTDGKKHWVDVIKNTGSSDLLVWRQPEEDFNTNSTLIVMPGEVAVFINGGTIEAVFDIPGTYTLSTENYPFISRLRNALSGGISTFNSIVYFIRTSHSLELPWGTNVQVRDKLLGIASKVWVRGSYKITVNDPTVLLEKLIGNEASFSTQAELSQYFNNQFLSKIKSDITKMLNDLDTELLGVEERLDELSESLEPSIESMLDVYGLRCVKFVISALEIDGDELRARYDEIGIDVIEKLRQAQADKQVMETLGGDWGKQQAANILGDLANNPGAGGVASAGAGLGMGVAAGGAFGNMAQQMFAPMSATQDPVKEQTLSSGRFIQEGADLLTAMQQEEATSEDPAEALALIKRLFELELISQEEYDEKKLEILKRI